MPIPYRCQLQFIQQNRHSIRSLKNRLSISQSDLPQLPIPIQEQTPLPEQSLQPLSDRPNTRLHNTRRHNQETPQGAGGRAGQDFRNPVLATAGEQSQGCCPRGVRTASGRRDNPPARAREQPPWLCPNAGVSTDSEIPPCRLRPAGFPSPPLIQLAGCLSGRGLRIPAADWDMFSPTAAAAPRGSETPSASPRTEMGHFHGQFPTPSSALRFQSQKGPQTRCR